MSVMLRSMTPPLTDTDTINSATAAQICGVHRATFNRWAQQGIVPSATVTPGGERLFSKRVVEQWIRKRRNKPVGTG